MQESLSNNVQSDHTTTLVPIYDPLLRGGRRHVCISWLYMEATAWPPPPTQRRWEATWLDLASSHRSIGFTIFFYHLMSHDPLREVASCPIPTLQISHNNCRQLLTNSRFLSSSIAKVDRHARYHGCLASFLESGSSSRPLG